MSFYSIYLYLDKRTNYWVMNNNIFCELKTESALQSKDGSSERSTGMGRTDGRTDGQPKNIKPRANAVAAAGHKK